MKAIKEKLKDALGWLLYFGKAAKFLIGGLLWDINIAITLSDRPWWVVEKRLRDIVWRLSKRVGLVWRESDPLWPGLKGCFRAYADAKRAAKEYKRLERKFRPLMDPGETLEHFILERLPQIMELASIGKKAQAEKKATARDD